MPVGGLDICWSLAYFRMQRNVAGRWTAVPFTVVAFHPVAVVSFPPFAGVSVGVMACVTVLIGYASTLHGMAKLELLSMLFLKVVPSCSGMPLHCA